MWAATESKQHMRWNMNNLMWHEVSLFNKSPKNVQSNSSWKVFKQDSTPAGPVTPAGRGVCVCVCVCVYCNRKDTWCTVLYVFACMSLTVMSWLDDFNMKNRECVQVFLCCCVCVSHVQRSSKNKVHLSRWNRGGSCLQTVRSALNPMWAAFCRSVLEFPAVTFFFPLWIFQHAHELLTTWRSQTVCQSAPEQGNEQPQYTHQHLLQCAALCLSAFVSSIHAGTDDCCHGDGQSSPNKRQAADF